VKLWPAVKEFGNLSDKITAAQARMARAALEWSLDDAAAASGVSRRTVLRLEQGESLQARNLAAIRRAFAAAGVRFFDEGPAAGAVAPPLA
jgi:transcriptional regulator with XRE-family HTH domain